MPYLIPKTKFKNVLQAVLSRLWDLIDLIQQKLPMSCILFRFLLNLVLMIRDGFRCHPECRLRWGVSPDLLQARAVNWRFTYGSGYRANAPLKIVPWLLKSAIYKD